MGLSSNISNMGISQLGALKKQRKQQEYKDIATLGGQLKNWSNVNTMTKEQLSNLNSHQQNHLEMIQAIHKKYNFSNKKPRSKTKEASLDSSEDEDDKTFLTRNDDSKLSIDLNSLDHISTNMNLASKIQNIQKVKNLYQNLVESQERVSKRKFVVSQDRQKQIKAKNDLNKWQRFKDLKLETITGFIRAKKRSLVVGKFVENIKVSMVLKVIWQKFMAEVEFRKWKANLYYVTFMISIKFKKTLTRITGGQGMPRKM